MSSDEARTVEQLTRDLQESERRYRDLIESRVDGTLVVGADLKILLANQALADMFGFDSPEEMLSINLFDYVPAEQHERITKIMAEDMFQNDLRQANEFRVFKKSGEEIWVSAIGVLSQYQGRPAGVASVRDITEQKRAAEALRKQEHFFRSLIENSSDAFMIVKADGTLDYASPSYERVMGYRVEERIGGGMLDNLHPDSVADAAALMEQLLPTPGRSGTMRVRVRHKDGSWRDIEATGKNLLDDTAVEGFVVTLHDITEHRQAEAALRRSEAMYRSIVELSPDAILTVDATGTVTSCNRAFAEGTGYGVHELVGRHFTDLPVISDPEDVPGYVQLFERMAVGEELTSFEYSWSRKDGAVRRSEVRAAPMIVDGEFRGTQAVMRDVTERKRSEEELRRQRDFAQSVLDTAQAIILILDAEGRIVGFNPYMQDVSGYRLEEVQGKDWFDTFLPERDHDRIRKLFRHAFGGVQTRGNTNPIVTRDGRERQIEWYDRTLVDANGETVGLLAIGQDVTERREAEEALKESEERFRRLFEESNDAVFIHDLEGNIHDVNSSACEMLGCSRDAVLGMTLPDLHPQEELGKFRQAIRATAERGSARYESRFRRADGMLVDVDISSRVVDPDKGLVQKVVRDITERRQAEEALRDLSRRLVLMQEDERRSIARELHDQTGQVLTYLSLLLDKCARLPADSIEATLDEAKTVVAGLIDQVRNLSLELRPSSLDDMGLLATLLWHFERYTSQTQVRVDFRHTGLHSSLPPDVSIAAYRIVQEGLTNVARHAGVDSVKVRVHARKGTLRVRIEDRGTGFVPEEARSSGGLGMMRERTSLLGGTLKVESSPGNGTTITAELPCDADE